MSDTLVFRNGEFYNQFGSVVYPRRKTKKEIRIFQEFELQAVAYIKLREFFKNDNCIRGEFSVRSTKDDSCYLRCDIAIVNKQLQPILIIEVKKNYREVENSREQIAHYKKHAPVYVISNMKDAENIVQLLMKKGLISIELIKILEPTVWKT